MNSNPEGGLLDSWEVQYFGNLNFGSGDDPDADGWSNAQEFALGMDPTVFSSPNGLTLANGLQVFTPLK